MVYFISIQLLSNGKRLKQFISIFMLSCDKQHVKHAYISGNVYNPHKKNLLLKVYNIYLPGFIPRIFKITKGGRSNIKPSPTLSAAWRNLYAVSNICCIETFKSYLESTLGSMFITYLPGLMPVIGPAGRFPVTTLLK